MLDSLKALNALISGACEEGGSLDGCTFYKNSLQEFTEFPAIGTKLVLVKILPTSGGTIVPTGYEVILFAMDLVDNHSDLVTMYDEILKKLNIIFGIAKLRTKDEEIDIVDDTFLGSKKGAVLAITIDI